MKSKIVEVLHASKQSMEPRPFSAMQCASYGLEIGSLSNAPTSFIDIHSFGPHPFTFLVDNCSDVRVGE
jgi:hypothetical protein